MDKKLLNRILDEIKSEIERKTEDEMKWFESGLKKEVLSLGLTLNRIKNLKLEDETKCVITEDSWLKYRIED